MSNEEKRNCEITGQPYTISAEEADAYNSFDLPLPSTCPQERFRRQLTFRNDKQFFWRRCDSTGTKLYSTFPEDAPFPVVSPEYWWSSDWDGTSFGRDFDFKRLFIEQLLDLWTKVPRPAYRLINSLESRACHGARDVGNSFLLFNAQSAACCMYSVGIWDSHHCCDCYSVSGCEYCYECTHCYDSKRLRYCEFSRNCEDSWFLSQCSNCKNCLFCTNLEGKEFCIFNRSVSAEEYQKALAGWSFTARPRVELAKEQFNEFLLDKPIPHIFSDMPDSTSGNYLKACDGVYNSYDCIECRGVLNCYSLVDAANCLDGFGFGNGLSDSVQFVEVGDGARGLINCIECWNQVSDLAYCSYCEQSSNLFGCVGLRGKEYCIFNKQYSKEQYLQLRGAIVDHLKSRRVWGKFFPASFSGFAYNQSSAEEHMPLSKIPAKMMGFRWDDSVEYIRPSQLMGGVDQAPDERFAEVPTHLDDLDENTLLTLVFICEMSGRPFRLTRDEIALYRMLSVPPPPRAFEQRHRERVMRLAPRALNMNKSARSGEELLTSYPQNWRRPVLSHDEWRKEVKRVSKSK